MLFCFINNLLFHFFVSSQCLIFVCLQIVFLKTLLTLVSFPSLLSGLFVLLFISFIFTTNAFLSHRTSVNAHASSIQCSNINSFGSNANIFYGTLIVSVLLPFFVCLVAFIYWFLLAPRFKCLSCGKELKITSCCPRKNPFNVHRDANRSTTKGVVADRWKVAISKMSSMETRKKHSTRDGFIVTNVLLIYILNPSIMKASFQLFQETRICGESFWVVDDSVKSFEGLHLLMILTVALPSLVFYGLICPCLAVFYIKKHKDRDTNHKLIFRFGLLYSGFSPNYWWYEIIMYIRKMSTVIIVTFAASNSQQVHITLGVLVVLLTLHEHLKPFENNKDTISKKKTNERLHRLEASSLFILIVMVWAAVFFILNTCNMHLCDVLGFIVLIANIGFGLACGLLVVTSCTKKHHVADKLSTLYGSMTASSKSNRTMSEANEMEDSSNTGSSNNNSNSIRSNHDDSIKLNPLAEKNQETSVEIGIEMASPSIVDRYRRLENMKRKENSKDTRPVPSHSTSTSTARLSIVGSDINVFSNPLNNT